MFYKEIGGLRIAEVLYDFVIYEALSGTGVGAQLFWTGLARLVEEFGPRIREQLSLRDSLQGEIDAYHLARRGQPFDAQDYEAHLRGIGYLSETPADCTIRTGNLDEAIAKHIGQRFIVPASNPRSILSAVNARWKSLYDALYGTDAIAEDGGAERGPSYNKIRGARVIARGRDFLDAAFPLATGSHKMATGYGIEAQALCITLETGEKTGLRQPEQFIGYQGRPTNPSAVLLRNKGLHIEIKIDRNQSIGREDRAGISDIILESALTAVIDFEDTVVAVDPPDKVGLYRNWLELMKGSLRTQFKKNGRVTDRLMALDRRYTDATGAPLNLPGRALMLARSVGPHISTDAVVDEKGEPICEMLLDIAVTSLIALHDLKRTKDPRNSVAGSAYIVLPKLHGPAEFALANEFFGRIEDMLLMPRFTLKMGIMDETCRTSVNLNTCIKAAADRIVFIDADLVDRCGDEIHTAMEAGPVLTKSALMASASVTASQHQARAGSAAWVASPTAAALHALAFHEGTLAAPALSGDSALSQMLMPPVSQAAFAAAEIAQELDANCQTILDYVARWIDQGIGCSQATADSDIRRMQDRASLRLASQHIANWLHHGTINEAHVKETLERMASVIDERHKSDAAYQAMAPTFDGHAFNVAVALIFKGRVQANGYVEALLYGRRREAKAGQKPDVTNRYEALKGAVRGLESGEAFLGSPD
jgi:malate synthase